MEKIGWELEMYESHLYRQEKSRNTIEKYLRDVRKFREFAKMQEPDREMVLKYKESLLENYQTTSVNSMLTALNHYLKYIGREELCVKTCRQQRKIFREEERELSRQDYQKLVREAKQSGKRRLFVILQTLAGTGIRIGELRYITVEALKKRQVQIDFKGKVRMIFLPRALTVLLKDYCRSIHRKQGSIFVTRNGLPVDRRNIWAEMKALCRAAKVRDSKVFPHNLRHLFAKCFYERERDLARLADYLGHSSVETTRRYTMLNGSAACEKQLNLGLLVEGMENAGEFLS